MNWKLVLAAVIAYFIGNISTGIIIGKLYGHRDIRDSGSGNAGTTNVMRTLGWLPSVLTLVGDCLKAFAAVKIGAALAGTLGGYFCGIAVMCGHIWPVVFQFRGGKGMACALGVIFAHEPLLAVALLIIQVAVVAVTRYMSVASLVTSVVYPFIVAFFHPGDWTYILFAIAMSILTIFCHRANISRLIQHKENRLDFDKISRLSAKLKQKRAERAAAKSAPSADDGEADETDEPIDAGEADDEAETSPDGAPDGAEPDDDEDQA